MITIEGKFLLWLLVNLMLVSRGFSVYQLTNNNETQKHSLLTLSSNENAGTTESYFLALQKSIT